MFESIHFQSFDFLQPMKSTDDIDQYKNLQDLIKDFKDLPAHLSFSIEGNSQFITPLPTTSYARDHLLYIQAFSLLDAGQGFFTKRKDYASYLLLYTYEGEGILEYDGKTYHLSPGYGFLIDCRKAHHYYTSSSHWKHAILHFNGTCADWLFEKFYMEKNALFFSPINSPFQTGVENLIRTYQTAGPYREFEVSVLLQTLLLDIIKEKDKDASHTPDYIRYLQNYMDHNFTNAMKLDDLSAFAGMSKYHLDREFKKFTGLSINAYLVELRLNHARFLLRNSDLSATQISSLSGFSTYANFLKLFKDRMQMTPTAYRKQG